MQMTIVTQQGRFRFGRFAILAAVGIALSLAIGAGAWAVTDGATAVVATQANDSAGHGDGRVGSHLGIINPELLFEPVKNSYSCVEFAGLCQPVRTWPAHDAPDSCVELAGLCQPVHTH